MQVKFLLMSLSVSQLYGRIQITMVTQMSACVQSVHMVV